MGRKVISVSYSSALLKLLSACALGFILYSLTSPSVYSPFSSYIACNCSPTHASYSEWLYIQHSRDNLNFIVVVDQLSWLLLVSPFSGVPIWTVSCKVILFFFFLLSQRIHYFLKLINLFLAALGLCCCTRLSLVVVSGGYSSLQCADFSLQWLLLLQSMGSRHAGFSSCCTRAQ